MKKIVCITAVIIIVLNFRAIAEDIAQDNIGFMYSYDSPFTPKTCMDICKAPYTNCAVHCTELMSIATVFHNDLVSMNSNYQGYFLINESPNQV